MQPFKNLSHLCWLVNSRRHKLRGASSQREDKQGPSIYLLSRRRNDFISFMTPGASMLPALSDSRWANALFSTLAASWNASLALLVAIVFWCRSWSYSSCLGSADPWYRTAHWTVSGPKSWTFSRSTSRLWGQLQTKDWRLQCFWTMSFSKGAFVFFVLFVVVDGFVVLFALEDNNFWKGLITTSDGTMAWKRPANFCTSAGRSSSSLSLPCFIICASLVVWASSRVPCHMFLSMTSTSSPISWDVKNGSGRSKSILL